MDKKQLKKLDLDEKEIDIFLALLELGGATVAQISQKSSIKRTTVYNILEDLKEKGLVAQTVKGRKKLYLSEDPRKLEDNLEEKKHVLKRLMPELLAMTNSIDSKPKIRFFEGKDGIKEVYKDTLRESDYELLAWVTNEAVSSFDIDFLNETYLPKRIEKKIWVRAIAPEVTEMKEYKETDEKNLRKTRLAPADTFPFKVEINLYGKNKIAVMSFIESFGIVIESLAIYETLKSIFEMNWASLKARNEKSNPATKEKDF